jgi:hypothetical protein
MHYTGQIVGWAAKTVEKVGTFSLLKPLTKSIDVVIPKEVKTGHRDGTIGDAVLSVGSDEDKGT